jgi:ribosomal protein S6
LEEARLNIYEGMFVLEDKRANESWDAVTKEIHGLLEKHGARVVRYERWDERRLAYRIKGRNRGVYVLTSFLAPGDAIAPIERDCQLNDTILRVLILRDHETEKLRKQGLLGPEAPDEQPEPDPDAGEAGEGGDAEQPKPAEGGQAAPAEQPADAPSGPEAP